MVSKLILAPLICMLHTYQPMYQELHYTEGEVPLIMSESAGHRRSITNHRYA